MFIGAARQKAWNKRLFIPQCYKTFRVLGRRKQLIVPKVSVSFVSPVDLIPWGRSAVRGSKRLCLGVAGSVVRICLGSDHWNCELKWGSANLHAVHLNFNKNNNLGVLCWVVFVMSRNCANSPDLFCYVCGEFTQKPQKKSITLTAKKACKFYSGCKPGDQGNRWTPHSC